MRVIATKVGFFGGSRVRVGAEFELPESACRKKDGTLVLPKWVVPASDKARADLKDAALHEAKHGREAAYAAAGPKRSKKGFASVEGAEDLV